MPNPEMQKCQMMPNQILMQNQKKILCGFYIKIKFLHKENICKEFQIRTEPVTHTKWLWFILTLATQVYNLFLQHK